MPRETDAALEALRLALERAEERLREARVRAEMLQAQRADGHDYVDIVAREERPLLVELLTEALSELSSAGASFRRAEAWVLHTGGMSQDEIAQRFGVTRQRVGALLRSARG